MRTVLCSVAKVMSAEDVDWQISDQLFSVLTGFRFKGTNTQQERALCKYFSYFQAVNGAENLVECIHATVASRRQRDDLTLIKCCSDGSDDPRCLS